MISNSFEIIFIRSLMNLSVFFVISVLSFTTSSLYLIINVFKISMAFCEDAFCIEMLRIDPFETNCSTLS